jgi:hypothetical protein
MKFKIGQAVLVDGDEGYVSAIYPNGKRPYIGEHHAYLWIAVPSLDYTDDRGYTVRAGRAVSFCDVDRRLLPCEC